MLEYTASYEPGNDIIAAYYLLKSTEYGDRIHEYDSMELRNAHLSLFENERNFGIITNDTDEDIDYAVREQRYLRKNRQAHREYIEDHPEILQKTEGFHVASFRFPVLCSLSFTNQFRRGVQSQIDKITNIGEKADHEKLMNCYKHIILAPNGYSLLTRHYDDTYFTHREYDPDTKAVYTYFHSMLIMPVSLFMHRDLPVLLFFWVRCRSKSDPKKAVRTYLEYPDDDLEFEITDHAPSYFPDDYKKLPTVYKSMLNRYEADIRGGTNEKKCIRTFLCDPDAWKEWLIPCCEHIMKCSVTYQ